MLTESDVRALRHEIRFAVDVEDVLDRILTLFSDTFPAALITNVREAVEAGGAIYSGTLLRILRSTHADDLFRAAQARRMFVDAEYGVLFSAGYGGREQEVLCAGIRQDVGDLTHAWRVKRMVEGLGAHGDAAALETLEYVAAQLADLLPVHTRAALSAAERSDWLLPTMELTGVQLLNHAVWAAIATIRSRSRRPPSAPQ